MPPPLLCLKVKIYFQASPFIVGVCLFQQDQKKPIAKQKVGVTGGRYCLLRMSLTA